MKRITTADIAQQLGLDKSTVSRALRDDPRIKEQTRQRVRAAADEMGYFPDPALAKLATHRWRSSQFSSGSVLAYIDFSQGEKVRLSEFSGIRHRAEKSGYQVDLFQLKEYPSMASLGRVLSARGIEGIILGPIHHAINWEGFQWERFYPVNCVPGHHSPPLHSVAEDHFTAVLRCHQEVRAMGYTRIGFAPLRHAYVNDDDTVRCAAVRQLLAETAPKQHIPPYLGSFTELDPFFRWFEKNRPQAVIGFNQMIGVWLQSSGWKVPQDVAFAGLSVAKDAKSQEYAGCHSNADERGSAAFFLADSLIRHNQRGIPGHPTRKILLSPEWRAGASCPPI